MFSVLRLVFLFSPSISIRAPACWYLEKRASDQRSTPLALLALSERGWWCVDRFAQRCQTCRLPTPDDYLKRHARTAKTDQTWIRFAPFDSLRTLEEPLVFWCPHFAPPKPCAVPCGARLGCGLLLLGSARLLGFAGPSGCSVFLGRWGHYGGFPFYFLILILIFWEPLHTSSSVRRSYSPSTIRYPSWRISQSAFFVVPSSFTLLFSVFYFCPL